MNKPYSEAIKPGSLNPLWKLSRDFTPRQVGSIRSHTLFPVNSKNSCPVKSVKISRILSLYLKDALRAIHRTFLRDCSKNVPVGLRLCVVYIIFREPRVFVPTSPGMRGSSASFVYLKAGKSFAFNFVESFILHVHYTLYEAPWD